jgi:beta-mannosidase
LRNHPSLAVVCGGNEQFEGWDEWGWRAELDRFYGERLFNEVGKEVAAKLTPELPYIINSPHGGDSCQAPLPGDAHNWGNFYNSTEDPLFVTETCWSQESYSRPETLEKIMGIDMADFTEVGWPAKWKKLTGLGLITRLAYTGGSLVCDTLDNYIRGLEIEQAIADHNALTQLLMRGSSCNGLIYWPLNKGGPLFQFGCVDYNLVPLASYYVVKRLFADLVVTLYRDIDDIRAVAVNRSLTNFEGELRIVHLDVDGKWLEETRFPARIPAGGRARLAAIENAYRKVVDRNGEVMKAELSTGGKLVSEETLFFTPLREFAVRHNAISAEVRTIGDGKWEVDVSANSLVKLFALEGNAKFLMTDNYFTLSPGMNRTIGVELVECLSDEPLALKTWSMDSAESYELML